MEKLLFKNSNGAVLSSSPVYGDNPSYDTSSSFLNNMDGSWIGPNDQSKVYCCEKPKWFQVILQIATWLIDICLCVWLFEIPRYVIENCDSNFLIHNFQNKTNMTKHKRSRNYSGQISSEEVVFRIWMKY